MASMPSAPVTRAQRQARTREALIETARDLFLSDGYTATSLDRVAVEAGFSKGAVYSNFSGKEELCLAVLHSIDQEQIDAVVAAFRSHDTLDERIEAFSRWVRQRLGQPRWTALEVEFASSARQSPYVAAELAKRNRSVRALIAELVAEVLEESGIRLSMTPDEVATALLSLGIGLGAQRSIDADVDVDVFTGMMRQVLGLPGS